MTGRSSETSQTAPQSAGQILNSLHHHLGPDSFGSVLTAPAIRPDNRAGAVGDAMTHPAMPTTRPDQRIGPLVSTRRFVSEATGTEVEAEAETRRRQNRRAGRYSMQRVVGKLLPQGNGINKCQSRALRDGNGVQRSIEIKKVEGTAYLNGVQSCGSVWMCPLCAPKILVRRAADIDKIMEVVQKKGATMLFVTLTCRHHAFESPDFTVGLVSGAFGKLLQGREWAGHTGKERQKRLDEGKPVVDGKRGEMGYIGMTRVMEVTHGPNGYHPHIHAGLVFDRPLSEQEIVEFEDWLFARWQAFLKKKGAQAVARELGVQVKRWQTKDHLGDYVTKIGHGWSLSSELTAGQEKEAKHQGHYNTAQLVRRYIEDGQSEEVAEVLRGMYRATKGKRMMYTSPALRKWADLGEEKSDEELANEDVQGVGVVSLAPELYGWLRRLWAIADILTSAEKQGVRGIVEHCEAIGLPVILQEHEESGTEEGRAPPPPRLSFDRSRWRN